MSSVHQKDGEARVEDGPDNNSTAVSQALEDHTAADGTSDTPTSRSQELENHTAIESTSETYTPNSQEMEKCTAQNKDTSDNQTLRYPAPLALLCLIIATCISVFLVSLDRTIITTVSM